MWQLLAWLNTVVIRGLRAGTCAVLRDSLLIVYVSKCVCHLCNKELPYFNNNNNNSNNNNNIAENVYGAIIMTQSLREFTRFI